ncbi:MAG: SpoIIE family protein phosphatase [Rhodocyclaceae bacterium]|nr:SpoIIE family protein phosphatase [Rhodocyclaceae bacterium]MDZ4214910.1 SpoIIE family protein phosphatase [Rhodocyclaceae bacterium]
MSNIEHQQPSILIVDDTPENIDVLKGVLKDLYIVRPAPSGPVALKIANSAQPPNLILLDIMMPEMDGFEVMRRLQLSPQTQGIPVIFITALADLDNEIRGLEAGAVDYITKPFNPLAVRRRVATHLALSEARYTLERRNKDLMDERRLVEDIIIRMRTSRFFDDRYLRYLITPVERTNGDILLAKFTPDGRQWVLVGDFTGHGLSAAVAAPLISQVFYGHAAADGNIEAAIAAINGVMYEQLPTEIFMAGVVIEVSADRSLCRLWNGAMPEVVVLDARRMQKKLFSSGLAPFGILPKLDVLDGAEVIDIAPGDSLYVFSDGATEVSNAAGELFGIERVQRFLAEETPATDPFAELVRRLAEFHASAAFSDDVTAVELHLRP